jgi:hypothetical protein
VVDAPTGAGKTYIFELFQQSLRGQAIYTVPTRALANDKLAEWRAKGWDVGICTGDIAERLDAKVVVATLETQKAKFLRQEGPRLLVIDEYQLISDTVRGASYELSIALAPPETQLLLMSGSVANPQDMIAWLERLGRKAELMQHRERPVPLEQLDLELLPDQAPASIRGWWPRMIANALAADLGPILIFAPRRKAAEQMATQLAAALPADSGIRLSAEEEDLAGPALKRLLKQRVAYHHSGLSFQQRAGLVEPLAKRGKLRVVVATMGLAAGINFSMRSVAVSGITYYAEHLERQVRPDELLQMFGRAGRRGLDEIGYVLVTPQPPRMLDGRPLTLRRAEPLDWPTLLSVMQAATERSADPFGAALEFNRRLFTPRELPLGVEHSRDTGPMPCGLSVDMERARFFRRGVTEMLNSRGEWQLRPDAATESQLGKVLIREKEHWRPALSLARALESRGFGALVKTGEGRSRVYVRELVVGSRRPDGSFALAPALRTKFAKLRVSPEELRDTILPRLPEIGGGRIALIEPRGEQLVARFAYDELPVQAWQDETAALLLDPPTRTEIPIPCRGCPEAAWCGSVPIENPPASSWRQLGLIEADGRPTRRGVLFGFFHHAEGFAISTALEDEKYTIGDLVFDLSNLRAGPRFAGDDSPYGGPLGHHSQQASGRAEIPGYLTMGVPLDYGAGASEAFRAHVEHHLPRVKLLTENLSLGDFERAFVEWRSLLRHIVWAPDLEWERWRELKAAAAAMIERTDRTG